MKIVCGSCGAKYSIADEKVQGKVFKIRCKKCSNVIVVKGDAQQDNEQPQNSVGDSNQAGAYGAASAASEWYVVVDGNQVGPVTPREIEGYVNDGSVTGESFAWREGLGDWVALSSLDEFAHLASAAGAVGEDATALMESPLAAGNFDTSGFGDGFPADDDATSLMPASDFRAQLAAKEAEAEAAAQGGYDMGAGFDAGAAYDSPAMHSQQGGFGEAASGGYDAFGSNADAGYDAGGYDAAGGGYDAGGYDAAGGGYDAGGYDAAGAGFDAGGGYDAAGGGYDSYDDESASQGGMFAAFDSGADGGDSGYDGFDGVGGDSAAAAAPANDLIGQRNENSVLFSLSSLDQVSAVSGDSPEPAAGGDAGITEGSGLIDIQALASAHKSMKNTGAAGAAGPGAGAEDPFGAGTMSMPALMPMGSHKSNKGLIIGLGLLGVVLIAGFGVVGYMLMNKDEPQPTERIIERVVERAVPADDSAAAKQEAEAAQAAAAAAKAAEDPETDEDGAVAAAGSNEEKSEEAAPKKAENKPASKQTASNTKSNPAPAPKPASRPAKKKDDDIFALLDKKKDDKPAAAPKQAAPKKDVPEKLSRSMVKNTISKYNGRVQTCSKNNNKNKLSGTVMVKFNIQESGRVSSASISTSKFKGTDVGTCVERVVRSMKFPETRSSLPVNYPFVLR